MKEGKQSSSKRGRTKELVKPAEREDMYEEEEEEIQEGEQVNIVLKTLEGDQRDDDNYWQLAK